MLSKKAEMGIGTLIIFIAMILVAAIAAGVLLQTATSLQNKALQTGDKSKTQVSTGLITLQIFAEDGETGQASLFCQNIKLQPGSDPMKFDSTLLDFDTDNVSSDKQYGNRTNTDISNASEINSGIDFDGDGTYDRMILNNSCEGLIIEISNGSSSKENVTINLTTDTGVQFAANESMFPGNMTTSYKNNLTVIDADVNDSINSRWGAISIVGWDMSGGNENCTLNNSKMYIIGAGSEAKSGYSVEYLVQGSSYISGYLNRGDVVKLCYTAPRIVQEDEDIAITIVPKVGHPTVMSVIMPEIMAQKRVYVYP